MRWRRAAVVAALLLVAVAAPALVLAATDGEGAESAGPVRCNGSADLCRQRVDDVTFPATHNSMSSPQQDFLFPDQQSGIGAQLRGGIRGLLIDTHTGAAAGGRVATLLAAGGKSRGKLEQELGREATATAERLRDRINYKGGGDERPYLCHGFCEIGAQDAVEALKEIREFLVANPGEVVLMSIEDQITPADTAAAFERSSLIELVWKGPIRPLPRLGDMIERDQRVLVFGEERTQGVPWYHQQFESVKESPYDLSTARQLLSPRSCRLNRGRPANPLLFVNHWVAKIPPLPSIAREVNRKETIVAHARDCAEALGGRPNLVAVDLWEEGDVVGAARKLNAEAPR